MNISEIKQAQKQAAEKSGRAWWFEKGAMRFFDSKVEPAVYETQDGKKFFFVTSEQCHFSDGTSAARKWSVRYWSPDAPDEISTEGKFQQFKTSRAAHRFAQHRASGGTLQVVE